MTCLQYIGMHTPIWPNPIQTSHFGDEQVLLSNLLKIATNITKTSFPGVLNLNCNQPGEVEKLLSGEGLLMKEGFGDASRFFVQVPSLGLETLPLKHEIIPPWVNRLYVPQIQIFGELYIFLINQTVISVVHRQPKTTNLHLVSTVTPLDLLL
jgi:hypothetical protein